MSSKAAARLNCKLKKRWQKAELFNPKTITISLMIFCFARRSNRLPQGTRASGFEALLQLHEVIITRGNHRFSKDYVPFARSLPSTDVYNDSHLLLLPEEGKVLTVEQEHLQLPVCLQFSRWLQLHFHLAEMVQKLT